MGVGSVGISPAPILQTACFISGNSASNILLAFCTISTVLESDPPCNVITDAARSPSSSCGINSPPKRANTPKLIRNSTIAETEINSLRLRAK